MGFIGYFDIYDCICFYIQSTKLVNGHFLPVLQSLELCATKISKDWKLRLCAENLSLPHCHVIIRRMEQQEKKRHVGMIAVVGRASVGKSSLVNAILGEKISIVSPIPQTTRGSVRGILTDERGQLVFVDTPGVHRAQSNLGMVMNKLARAAVEGVSLSRWISRQIESAP